MEEHKKARHELLACLKQKVPLMNIPSRCPSGQRSKARRLGEKLLSAFTSSWPYAFCYRDPCSHSFQVRFLDAALDVMRIGNDLGRARAEPTLLSLVRESQAVTVLLPHT